ncbi:MAG: YIP1 family protein [Verrucomicrobia bacterium]|nr:YIP1 family protein [Verrucomicrobiota bacterium]
MIHINRAGSNLGIFSEGDVRAGLRSGQFAPGDLGWREGMPKWQPLSEFTEFAADIPAAAPSPPPVPPPLATASTSFPPQSTRAPGTGLPWDERQTRGIANAFIETMKLVLTQPGAAFTAMKRAGGFTEPLLYALIGSCIGAIVSLCLWMFMPAFGGFSTLGTYRGSPMLHAYFGGITYFFLFLFVPFGVIIGAFLGSAILHVCLMIVGGAKQPFETTFRVLCFAMGSVDPLLIIPFCGGLIVGVWRIVLIIIGLARAHDTDTGRAAIAVFLPLIVCCVSAVVIAMMFGMLGALAHNRGY